jgi:hypothetical protein
MGPNLGKNLYPFARGTLAPQPGPRFQQIGDGDGGESRIPDKLRVNRGRGRGSVRVPAPGQIGDGRPRAVPGPVPGQIGRGTGTGTGTGTGDRGVRALGRAIRVIRSA